MADVKVSETVYGEFGRCIRITNDIADILVTIDIGPRVIKYALKDGVNEFCENNAEASPSMGDVWKIRGGHRLWHSPEALPRSYMPDNSPVEWSAVDGGIKVSQPVEQWTQIKKEMEITLNPSDSRVKVVHRLTNKGPWPVEYSVWALSVMAAGGVQVMPQPARDTGLLPNRMVALWPYSKMNDPRINWGDRYIVLRQIPGMKAPFKLGIPNEGGWAAYFNHGNLFIKHFSHIAGGRYPDYGSSYETYTNHIMMEMESLSPLKLVEPEETLTHTEEWELIGGIDMPSGGEEEIESVIKKYIIQ